jgi:hypothetical protein
MPKLDDVLAFLNPRTASMAATANKKTRSAAKVRMSSPTAKRTMKNALKAKAQSKNLNNVYNSLWRLGEYSILNKNVNTIIGFYPYLRNNSLTQKQQDRLLRIMKSRKANLRKELNERNKQRMRIFEKSILNTNSESNRNRNYNNRDYWR